MSVPSRPDGYVHLADYRPPAWRIPSVDLQFDLDPEATIVEARLALSPDPAQPGVDPLLDGEELDLLASAAVTKNLSAVVKYADYDGVPGFADRRKVWIGFEFKL